LQRARLSVPIGEDQAPSSRLVCGRRTFLYLMARHPINKLKSPPARL
jgi:hypothetical protein